MNKIQIKNYCDLQAEASDYIYRETHWYLTIRETFPTLGNEILERIVNVRAEMASIINETFKY